MMESTFKEFSTLLHKRLSKGVYTTERCILHTFFVSLLDNTDLEPHDIIFEYPYPLLPGKWVDTYIQSLNGKPIGIEFKYHREGDGKGDFDHASAAGKLFNDMVKLSTGFGLDTQQLLVYCTDRIMKDYFGKARHGHTAFSNLRRGAVLKIDEAYIGNKCKSFNKCLIDTPDLELRCIWKEELPSEHLLKIFEVHPVT